MSKKYAAGQALPMCIVDEGRGWREVFLVKKGEGKAGEDFSEGSWQAG